MALTTFTLNLLHSMLAVQLYRQAQKKYDLPQSKRKGFYLSIVRANFDNKVSLKR